MLLSRVVEPALTLLAERVPPGTVSHEPPRSRSGLFGSLTRRNPMSSEHLSGEVRPRRDGRVIRALSGHEPPRSVLWLSGSLTRRKPMLLPRYAASSLLRLAEWVPSG